jgi:hypothetical protein
MGRLSEVTLGTVRLLEPGGHARGENSPSGKPAEPESTSPQQQPAPQLRGLKQCDSGDLERGAGGDNDRSSQARATRHRLTAPRHAAETKEDLTDHFWPPRLVLRPDASDRR